MREAIPTLPQYAFWRVAQLKHEDNFTFYLTLLTEVEYEDVEWIKLALHKDQCNIKAGKFLE
jgi:hypothetical protein